MVKDAGSFYIEHDKKEHALRDQLLSHFQYLYADMELLPEASNIFPGASSPKIELGRYGYRLGGEIIGRNNLIAEMYKKPELRKTKERQLEQKGPCALKLKGCIDGRYGWVHIVGMAAGIYEIMAGVAETTSSPDGKTRFISESLNQTIIDRPKKENSEFLEIDLAHASFTDGIKSNCGAMALFKEEYAKKGKHFETDDLVLENLKLFQKGIETAKRLYNSSANEIRKPLLKKVAIKGVLDTDSQGIMIGYGEEKPLFTSKLVSDYVRRHELGRKLSESFHDDPRYSNSGYFRNNFTQIDKFIEKEEMVTNITGFLLNYDRFKKDMAAFSASLEELDGLTAIQLQAFNFLIAKTMAFQYVSGLFEVQKEDHHNFSHHQEEYQTIAIDDGLTVTMGQFDPEVQAFGSSAPSSTDAIKHIETQCSLMESHGAPKPYLLFISSALPEGTKSEEGMKQARANLARTYHRLTENKAILEKVRKGEIIPIPVLIESGDRKIIEVPNLCL